MGLRHTRPTKGMAAADLDLEGDGSLRDFSDIVTLSSATRRGIVNEYTFTPIFSNLDDDGYLGLVAASDFDASQMMVNRGGQCFEYTTTERINDRNGMGSDVGDMDNDGDFGWFVTAISPISIPKHRTTERMRAGRLATGSTRTSPGWATSRTPRSLPRGFRHLRKPRHLPHQWIRGGRAGAGRLIMASDPKTWYEEAEDCGITPDEQGRPDVCTDYNDDGTSTS